MITTNEWAKKLGCSKTLYVNNKKIYKFVAAFHVALCKSYSQGLIYYFCK